MRDVHAGLMAEITYPRLGIHLNPTDQGSSVLYHIAGFPNCSLVDGGGGIVMWQALGTHGIFGIVV